jgi:hypothetical protein
MATQLRPFSVLRSHKERGGHPLSTVSLVRGQQPPAEHVELRVGGGFKNISEVVAVLHAIAAGLQSSNGFAPHMETVDE